MYQIISVPILLLVHWTSALAAQNNSITVTLAADPGQNGGQGLNDIQCNNGQLSATVNLLASINPGGIAEYQPMAELGLPMCTGSFFVNGVPATVTSQNTFNVASSAVSGNQWTFGLANDRPHPGGLFTFGPCTTASGLTASFNCDPGTVPQGLPNGADGLPPVPLNKLTNPAITAANALPPQFVANGDAATAHMPCPAATPSPSGMSAAAPAPMPSGNPNAASSPVAASAPAAAVAATGSPAPAPATGGGQAVYCPSANDLTTAYGTPMIFNQGWTIHGGGGVATKSTFNLLGGSVEFDLDFSGVNPGVNANVYSITPTLTDAAGFTGDAYCDGSIAASKFCVEMDWIESNGGCGGASTLHTTKGPGPNACNSWGCGQSYLYNSVTKFHMKITHDTTGQQTVFRNSQIIPSTSFNAVPSAMDNNLLAQAYQNQGALVYSSQWTGWVPLRGQGNCSDNGSVAGSMFTMSNLRITGVVVQGPRPATC